METTLNTKNKIHPLKMYLYVGLGSIVMMFAGLTSAYIVKKSQANWLDFELEMQKKQKDSDNLESSKKEIGWKKQLANE